MSSYQSTDPAFDTEAGHKVSVNDLAQNNRKKVLVGAGLLLAAAGVGTFAVSRSKGMSLFQRKNHVANVEMNQMEDLDEDFDDEDEDLEDEDLEDADEDEDEDEDLEDADEDEDEDEDLEEADEDADEDLEEGDEDLQEADEDADDEDTNEENLRRVSRITYRNRAVDARNRWLRANSDRHHAYWKWLTARNQFLRAKRGVRTVRKTVCNRHCKRYKNLARIYSQRARAMQSAVKSEQKVGDKIAGYIESAWKKAENKAKDLQRQSHHSQRLAARFTRTRTVYSGRKARYIKRMAARVRALKSRFKLYLRRENTYWKIRNDSKRMAGSACGGVYRHRC
jgi:hypothetical protein